MLDRGGELLGVLSIRAWGSPGAVSLAAAKPAAWGQGRRRRRRAGVKWDNRHSIGGVERVELGVEDAFGVAAGFEAAEPKAAGFEQVAEVVDPRDRAGLAVCQHHVA